MFFKLWITRKKRILNILKKGNKNLTTPIGQMQLTLYIIQFPTLSS